MSTFACILPLASSERPRMSLSCLWKYPQSLGLSLENNTSSEKKNGLNKHLKVNPETLPLIKICSSLSAPLRFPSYLSSVSSTSSEKPGAIGWELHCGLRSHSLCIRVPCMVTALAYRKVSHHWGYVVSMEKPSPDTASWPPVVEELGWEDMA